MHNQYSSYLIDTCPEDWPEDYSISLLRLAQSLSGASNYFIAGFKSAAHSSPPLRHLWKEITYNRPLEPKKGNTESDPIVLLFSHLLSSSEDQGKSMELHLILEDMNRLRVSGLEHDAKVTPLVSDLLADLGVVEEIRCQI